MSSGTAPSDPVVLLTGADGQIGWELRRTLATLGKVVACGRSQMRLEDADEIRRVIRSVRPDVIVNAAAFTAVEKAEYEPELAMAINGTAPGVIAEEARRVEAAVVHYSTDYVFDGNNSRAYVEEDAANPLSVYGRSKLAGEAALRQASNASLILRTGWVFGRRGQNFLAKIQRLASEREALDVVDDQIGTPTWCRLVADATARILSAGNGHLFEHVRDHGGVYHLSCAGQTSWWGFARRILDLTPPGKYARNRVNPIKADDLPASAVRPAYSVLNNRKMHRTFGVRLPEWEQALAMALARSSVALRY